MMTRQITRGKAAFERNALRCAGKHTDPKRSAPCGRLIVKLNRSNQLAGEFKCERCHQIIEVTMIEEGRDAKSS